MEILLYFILGAIISVFSGFFGIGGGLILTPILILFQYNPLEAVVTSLFFTIGTSMSGIFAHVRLKNIHWKEGLFLGLSGVAATQVARPFALFMESKGYDEVAIPAFYIILLSYFAITMFKQGSKKPSTSPTEGIKPSALKIILIGFFGGFVSTTLGVGGGFIMVPLSIAFLGFAPKKAVGTSLFAVLMIVAVGFISYSFSVSIDYRVGLLLIVGGLLGSQYGAKLTTYYENKEISTFLGILYIVTLSSVALKLVNLNLVGLGLLTAFIIFFYVRSFMKRRLKLKSMANTGS